MRHADHGTFQHAVLRIQQQLQLFGVDVVAARDDQILAAPHDCYIAVRVLHPQIASDEKPVCTQLLCCFLGHVPIALKHIRPAYLNNACLASRQFRAIGITDAQLNIRQRQANGACPPRALIGVGGVHVGFRHAIAFQNPVAGPRLEGRMGISQQRRRARNEQPHSRRQIAVKPRVVQQAGVECRHAHHRGCARHPLDQLVNVQLWQEHHRPARDQHHVCRHEKPVGVEYRQRMQQHVRLCETPQIRQRLGVADQVLLAQHRPFGPARGAGCIEKRRQIVRATRHRIETLGLFVRTGGQRPARRIQRRKCGTRRLRNRLQLGCARRVRHQQLCPAVAHEIGKLRPGIGRVQRQENRARLRAGGIKRQHIGALLHLYCDPVAHIHAEYMQRMGQLCRATHKRGMGDHIAVWQVQEWRVAVCVGCKHRVIKRVVHGLASVRFSLP